MQIFVIDHWPLWLWGVGLLRFVLPQVTRDIAERRSLILRNRNKRGQQTERRRERNLSRSYPQDGESEQHEFGTDQRASAQPVHKQSLGEMEEKRSNRRDTVVLAPTVKGLNWT